MGASKKYGMELHEQKVHEQELLMKSGTRRSAVVNNDLVPCQRCGRSYIPNDYEVCIPCADELDHNMSMDESYE